MIALVSRHADLARYGILNNSIDIRGRFGRQLWQRRDEYGISIVLVGNRRNQRGVLQ
jgi:hypothetical protein